MKIQTTFDNLAAARRESIRLAQSGYVAQVSEQQGSFTVIAERVDSLNTWVECKDRQ